MISRPTLCFALVAVGCGGSPAHNDAMSPGDAASQCPDACPEGTACDQGVCSPASWASIPTPSTDRLTSAWGASSTDVWVTGDNGTILHWNGTAFEAVLPPDMMFTSSSMLRAWGTAAGNVWIAKIPGGSADAYSGSSLLHWNGSAWTGFVPRPPPSPTSATMTGLWGSSATDVWSVGLYAGAGTILHFDGGSEWTAITETTFPENNGIVIQGGFADLWGSAANDVWAVGETGIWHFDGAMWSKYDPQPSTEIFRSIHGSSPTNVWVAAEAQDTPTRSIYRFDGMQWTAMPYPMDGYVAAVWAAADNDVWAVGDGPNGGIFHYNGSTWSVSGSAASARNLTSVWGRSASDIWAVGSDGTAWHYTKTN